jgi:hypothetical protein
MTTARKWPAKRQTCVRSVLFWIVAVVCTLSVAGSSKAAKFRLPLDADTTTHYFYDHSAAACQTCKTDWQCDVHTYHGHHGTDFSGGSGNPIRAAAAGTIVDKLDACGDGAPGNNCGGGFGNNVKVDHGDGLFTIYAHMVLGSVTTKAVGTAVTCGEILGRVGTSGDSSGAHLHFELQRNWVKGISTPPEDRLDPYKGTCNPIAASYWADQGSYGSPAVTCDLPTINVNAKNDAAIWTGPVNFNLDGPSGICGAVVPLIFNGPAGTYTVSYLNGGPASSTFMGITPSASQTVSAGGMITFTLNFSSSIVCSASNFLVGNVAAAGCTVPSVTTNQPSYVGANSATFNATITSDGGSPILERRFEWGIVPNWTYATNTTGDTIIVSGNTFSQVTGLLANTTYQVRAWARNSVDWTMANTVTFTTGSTTTNCSFSFSPPSASPAGNAGTGSISVTGSPSGCTGTWSAIASSTGSWLTLTGTASGSGAGTTPVPYSYTTNPSTTSSRSGNVTFSGNFPAGNTFTVTQSPSTAAACTYSFAQSSATAPGSAGNGSVNVIGSPSGCSGSWSVGASSSGNWLSLTGGTNGNGAGTWPVAYSYGTNPSTTSTRSGTITLSGSSSATFTLTQDPSTPGACSYSITPPSATGAGSGGSGNVQVTGNPSGCIGSWNAVASSSGNWLTLGGSTNGNGAGTWLVAYSFGANPSTTSERTGTISFSGSFSATFTLTQSPSPVGGCTYSINPASATGPANGGTGSVQVTSSPTTGCSGSWNAVASSSGNWLTLTGTTGGNGAGTWPVTYSFGANPNTSSRNGTISFSGSSSATFTLTQSGASGGSELLVDGGFESATATGNAAPGWTVEPYGNHNLITYHGSYPKSGSNYAALGVDDNAAEDIYQYVTIGSNVPSASLSFWVNVVTQEFSGSGAYDYLQLHIFDANGNWIAKVAEVTNEDASRSNNTSGTYFKVGPIDLSAYKGSSLFIMLYAVNDVTLPTTFLIDDVSLSTQTGTGVSGLYVLTPCRLLDTRNALGPFGGPALQSGSSRNVQVAGQCGIAADATAVAVNVAVVAPATGGYVTAYPGPAGTQIPIVSTINYSTGRTLANNAVVKLGPDGTMNLYNVGTNLNFVIDVTGYFK